jgi:hypothetical protein
MANGASVRGTSNRAPRPKAPGNPTVGVSGEGASRPERVWLESAPARRRTGPGRVNPQAETLKVRDLRDPSCVCRASAKVDVDSSYFQERDR